MDFYRTYAKRRFAYIIASVTGLIALNNFSGIKYLEILLLLVIIWNTLSLIYILHPLLDETYPIKTPIAKNQTHKYASWISTIMLFVSLFLLLREIHYLDNTIKGLRLFWLSTFTGLITGVLLLLWLYKIESSILKESDSRINALLGFPMVLFLFFSSSASYINRNFASDESNCKHYEVNRKGTDYEDNEFYLFVEFKSSVERITVEKKLWEKCTPDTELNICTRTGFLGYECIENVSIGTKSE